MLGAAAGSFLHCIVVREAANEKWTTGRSECDHCKKPLAWTSNVPILGYLLSKGRTSCCNKPLTPWHFIIEILGSALFVLVLWQWTLHGDLLLLLQGIVISIFAIYTLASDGRFMHVSVPMSLVSGLLLLSLATVSGTLLPALGAGLVGVLFFGIQYALTRGRGIGSGDLILGGIIGIALGFPGVVIGILAGYVIGATHALFLIATNRATGKTRVPLGAYLMLGMLFAFFFEDNFLSILF